MGTVDAVAVIELDDTLRFWSDRLEGRCFRPVTGCRPCIRRGPGVPTQARLSSCEGLSSQIVAI